MQGSPTRGWKQSSQRYPACGFISILAFTLLLLACFLFFQAYFILHGRLIAFNISNSEKNRQKFTKISKTEQLLVHVCGGLHVVQLVPWRERKQSLQRYPACCFISILAFTLFLQACFILHGRLIAFNVSNGEKNRQKFTKISKTQHLHVHVCGGLYVVQLVPWREFGWKQSSRWYPLCCFISILAFTLLCLAVLSFLAGLFYFAW